MPAMAPRKKLSDGEVALLESDAEMLQPIPEEFRYNTGIYFAMLIMGLGLLTSWNIVMNSIPYLAGLYPGDVGKNIAFYLTCANSYPGLPVLFLMVKAGDKIPLGWRIPTNFALQGIIMAILPFVAPLSYWAPLILMFFNGLTLMVLQSSLFGLQAQLPPIMAQAAMGGQGWAGVVASAAQIIVMGVAEATGRDDTHATALAYYFFAAFLLFSCAGMYVWLARQPFTRYHIERTSGAKGKGKDVELGGVGSGQAKTGAGEEEEDDESAGLVSNSSRGMCGRELSVLRKIWRGALTVHLIFVGTFILFPGVMDSIPYRGGFGQQGAWLGNKGWWSVILLAMFNIFDTAGRMLPAKVICLPERSLLPLAIVRFALVGWFLACARSWIASTLAADILGLLALAVLGFTNGYLTSVTLMAAPGNAADHEKETAGFLLSLTLNLGIVLGSQIALAFR